MTHEHTLGDEPEGGPEHDDRLPDARDVDVTDEPQSADPLDDDPEN